MNEEACEAIREEWRGVGLARCLAGEDEPEYRWPLWRVVKWREPVKSRRCWTAEEDEILHKHYYAEGLGRLLPALPHRSPDAIRARAQRLGLQPHRKGRRST